MRECPKCHVKISGPNDFCPLCQSPTLTLSADEEPVFPQLKEPNEKYHLALRLLALVSLLAGITCVLVNLAISHKLSWSLFAIAILVCFWISFGMAIYQRKNLHKNILYQNIIISVLIVLWDLGTGWDSWSIEFVIPILTSLTLVNMFILAATLHLHINDYVIYMLLNMLPNLGLMICLGIGLIKYSLASYLSIGIAAALLVVLLVFNGSSIKAELARRLHI